MGWACASPETMSPAESGPIVVRFETAIADPGREGDSVAVSGLGPSELRTLARIDPSASEWGLRLPVQVGESAGEQPLLLGDYRVEGERVVFRPRFPLVSGETYHARWLDPLTGEELARASVRLDRVESGPAPRVVAVYPSADRLPENLLRLYVQFSAPMSREHAARHLSLVGPDGPVALPFVAPEHELWNSARDRLTLVLDPGRVKRGVGPNVELGPVLAAGAVYRLEVAAGWPDGSGRPTAESFVKAFRVVPADRSSPRPDDWQVFAPRGPREPLEIHFEAPLDRALLAGSIRVETGDGRAIDGRVAIGGEELTWTFRPRNVWPSDSLRVLVDRRIEDPSGNRIDRLFDEAMGREVGVAEHEPVVFELEVGQGLRG